MDLVAFNAPSDPTIQQWRAEINYACEGTNVPPCLLAAIIKRETNGRNVLQEGMSPGPGCGCGLTQITSGVDWTDLEHPKYDSLDLLTPSSNLHVAVNNFLEPLIKNAQDAQFASPESFKAACRGQQVFAVACGYNAGWGKVEQALTLSIDADQYTTDNYGTDVLQKYVDFVTESHA